jgi:glycosyltransferase involved in cell wall biosynthesis
VAIVAPTCFYYQAAMFRQLAADSRLDLTVHFCSDEGIVARDVLEMYKVNAHWGMSDELLEGYHFTFLKNFAPHPSYLKWPFGLINVGIIKEIILNRPDVVVLMSWMNPTWWMALVACALFRIPFFYMTDANVQIEPLRSKWKRQIKLMVLGKLLFKLSSGFLCAGTANNHFYKMYGVPDKKLFPFAYSWGYDSLSKISEELKPQRNQLRSEFGIPENSFVILYCGRLSSEKNLFHLVDSYHRLDHGNKSLILIGDGDLRQSLQNHVEHLGAESVRFFGFQNRSQIAKFYAISDVLVLASVRETWGIVVNEAMCFGLPVIVSRQVGAGVDLVSDGENGYSVETDGESLFLSMKKISELSQEEISQMGIRSADTINEWSGRDLAELLVKYVGYVKGK